MFDTSPYYPPDESTPRLPRRDFSEGCDCCSAYGEFRPAAKEDNIGHILCQTCYDGGCSHSVVRPAGKTCDTCKTNPSGFPGWIANRGGYIPCPACNPNNERGLPPFTIREEGFVRPADKAQ